MDARRSAGVVFVAGDGGDLADFFADGELDMGGESMPSLRRPAWSSSRLKSSSQRAAVRNGSAYLGLLFSSVPHNPSRSRLPTELNASFLQDSKVRLVVTRLNTSPMQAAWCSTLANQDWSVENWHTLVVMGYANL